MSRDVDRCDQIIQNFIGRDSDISEAMSLRCRGAGNEEANEEQEAVKNDWVRCVKGNGPRYFHPGICYVHRDFLWNERNRIGCYKAARAL